MIQFLQKNSHWFINNANFEAKVFGENIFKIIASDPGTRVTFNLFSDSVLCYRAPRDAHNRTNVSTVFCRNFFNGRLLTFF
jgi:hypothetical protein